MDVHNRLLSLLCAVPACVRAPGRRRTLPRSSIAASPRPPWWSTARTSRSCRTPRTASSATSSTGAPSTGPRSSAATTRAAGRARWPTTSASPTAARRTPGPQLPFQIAACDAPDGSHWALQQWSRLWKNYGGDSAPAELYISHWRGNIGELQIQTDYSYHGKHQHLWGSFTFHDRPVFGTKWTKSGVPMDKQGRNIYVDYLKGPDLAPRQQLPHASAHCGLLLHVRQPSGQQSGLGRPGHGRRLPRHGHRPGRLAARAGALRAARPLQPHDG